MLVIYNNGAILLALIGFILMAVFNWLLPAEWMEGRKGMELFFGVITVIGGVMEFSNMRPRIFFLPTFLWSALFFCILMNLDYGTKALVTSLAVVTVFSSTIYLYLRKSDTRNWALAQSAFSDAISMELDTQNPELWKALDDALYYPVILSFSTNIEEHNKAISKVITLMLTDEENQQLVERLESKIFPLNSDLYEALKHVTASKMKQLARNNSLKAGTPS